MKKYFFASLLFVSLYSYGQTGSEIYLFDMNISNGVVTISNGINITHHKGYDNQPHFHPVKPLIYYTSFDDSSRSDLKIYNYETKSTSSLTVTRDREYSATVTPDGKFISCIIQRDNGNQDLGKYPIDGGVPIVMINDLKVGYHAWANNNQLLLFVLRDTSTNTLDYYDLAAKKDTILATNPGRSLHKIPGYEALSFIQKNKDKDWMIKKIDMQTLKIDTITHTIPGQENLAWLRNDIILMNDGVNIFSYHVGVDKEWQIVHVTGDVSMFKGVSRMAVNIKNDKIAVVVSE